VTEDWTPVGALDDLPDGRPAAVEVGDAELLLYRMGDSVFAVSDRCTHMGAQLHRGVVRSSGSLVSVTCPMHGSMFSLGDGRVLRGPAAAPIAVWDTRVVDGGVEVRARS
jgi:nitrite reductase/ring-hydroxylating ferredoxin subunit